QIRNATLRIQYGDTRFLIDPMLADKDAYPGFQGTMNSEIRYPRLELPMDVEAIIDVDAVILTHLHADHWDEAAKRLLPRTLPIFVQNEEDAAAVRGDGFTDVRVLSADSACGDVQLIKTEGQHGTTRILGKTAGVVFE